MRGGLRVGLKACEASAPIGGVSTGLGPGSELATDSGPDQRVGPDIGPELDARELTVATVLDGPNSAGPPAVGNSGCSGVDFSNEKVPLVMVPPPGFHWQFLAGVWALVPALVLIVVGVEGLEGELKDLEGIDTQSADGASPYHISKSNESMSEFEKNLRDLLPDLPVGKNSYTSDQPKGIRRSGRPKKPLSRFDEEVEPPKSFKKKVTSGEALEGTSLKPLLILDWSNE